MKQTRNRTGRGARRSGSLGTPMVAALAVMGSLACAGHGDRETLAGLRNRQPDLTEAPIDDGIDQAMAGYRKFLAEAPKSALTPEAMRRLADLKLEKEYGFLESPAPGGENPSTGSPPDAPLSLPNPSGSPARPNRAEKSVVLPAAPGETQTDFEARAAAAPQTAETYANAVENLALPGGGAESVEGPLEAIALYDQILKAYPNYAQTDQVLYQKARAFDELGEVDQAVAVAQDLIERFPHSRHIDEIQFRRGEYYFTRKKYLIAEESYVAIVSRGATSDYFELALYKLGWAYYKQMMLEEALESYVQLLDHKVDAGYDFDQIVDETEEQRIADTYRVMSLCFSDLGGAEAVTRFFAEKGNRTYEDRVYRHLGEFYLEKRRYADAASAYEAFVDLNPNHKISPHFSMRVVEIYEAGDFPKLVLASKKKFAAAYGLESDYWNHFEVAEATDVLDFLKGNLGDLANHYHALYQNTDQPEDKPGHFTESAHWYRAYLTSFPRDTETPNIHYQLADLLLQNEDFKQASAEYERIAYDYPAHERSASAGYAAIFSHRQREKKTEDVDREPVQREAVASTMRFVDAFGDHEHAPAVLGAAINDLYNLEEFASAIESGHRLLKAYPESPQAIRRAAWTVIAHSSFDTEAFDIAENAYSEVLAITPPEDESAQKITNNLAASIYKQGEAAREASDYRGAADHFLRIAGTAPNSEIRPIAEYDAASALIELKDWTGAAGVLESFRNTHPQHDLIQQATRQIAFVYREDGNLGRAAEEYVRVASEADEPELRREALLVAGELYEEAQLITKAITTYQTYVTDFTKPIEPAVVARFKMANLYHISGDSVSRREQLEAIVTIDRLAGDERTDAVRLHAGKSALILSESAYNAFAEVELTLPFEQSLELKKKRMSLALKTFGGLLDYEVGEITAAATYFMAEVYGEFSRALLESERPTDLGAAEQDQYEAVLEEEAYPFEEKAIGVHEKNLELMRTGVFNNWIEKSLTRLAEVMPGRYAKFEASSGLLPSISTYAYQTPESQRVLPVAETLSSATDQSTEDPPEQNTASEENGIPALETETSEALPASPAPISEGEN